MNNRPKTLSRIEADPRVDSVYVDEGYWVELKRGFCTDNPGQHHFKEETCRDLLMTMQCVQECTCKECAPEDCDCDAGWIFLDDVGLNNTEIPCPKCNTNPNEDDDTVAMAEVFDFPAAHDSNTNPKENRTMNDRAKTQIDIGIRLHAKQHDLCDSCCDAWGGPEKSTIRMSRPEDMDDLTDANGFTPDRAIGFFDMVTPNDTIIKYHNVRLCNTHCVDSGGRFDGLRAVQLRPIAEPRRENKISDMYKDPANMQAFTDEIAERLRLRMEGHELQMSAADVPLRDSIMNYIAFGDEVGGFLAAVFSNDLFAAMGKADLQSRAGLHDIVRLMYNHAPTSAWGTRNKYADFVESYGLAGVLVRESYPNATPPEVAHVIENVRQHPHIRDGRSSF